MCNNPGAISATTGNNENQKKNDDNVDHKQFVTIHKKRNNANSKENEDD